MRGESNFSKVPNGTPEINPRLRYSIRRVVLCRRQEGREEKSATEGLLPPIDNGEEFFDIFLSDSHQKRHWSCSHTLIRSVIAPSSSCFIPEPGDYRVSGGVRSIHDFFSCGRNTLHHRSPPGPDAVRIKVGNIGKIPFWEFNFKILSLISFKSL